MSSNGRDPASNQLLRWYEKNKSKIGFSTTDEGGPLINKESSVTVGRYGPLVLQDFHMTRQLTNFIRERIPERIVHAKGAGAFGYFEVLHDITELSSAKIFEFVGKKTPIAVRFSQVVGNLGSADTVRDPRGFALKFYTEDGIYDLVGNNTPIFFIRDPILFPMFAHTQKRNPVTNMRDWDMFWDFLLSRPESVHQTMILFSDRGIPDGHRHMHGFGSHTYSLINKDRKLTYCKFIFRTDQGIKNIDPEKAAQLAGKDPDYALRDLYNAIVNGKKTGKFPSWSFYIQIMTPEQATKQTFNPFDITTVWPHKEFPLIPVGRLVLNRNPANYFEDVEQLGFNPSNLIPGIGPSPDRLLQSRLMFYHDAQHHRLGVNAEQLPVNRTINKVSNFQRDGHNVIYNQGGAPNYHPNMFGGPNVDPNAKNGTPPPEFIQGTMDYHDLGDDDWYTQPGVFWNRVLDTGAKNRLVENLASTIKLANVDIQRRAVKVFSKVAESFGEQLRYKLQGERIVKF